MTAGSARIRLLPRAPLAVSARQGGSGLAFKPYASALDIYFATLLRGEKGDTGSALSTYICAVPISGHKAVTLNGQGLAIPADCRTAAHAGAVLGVTTGAAGAGAAITVMRTGRLESAGWGLSPEAPLYLGEDGTLVQTVPLAAAFTKPLGLALTVNAVLIDLQPAIFIATN